MQQHLWISLCKNVHYDVVYLLAALIRRLDKPLVVLYNLIYCIVGVALLWNDNTYTFAPQNSSVQVNCTAETPRWLITIPGRSPARLPGDVQLLSNNGFRELQQINLETTAIIRLLLNSTVKINGSVITCEDERALTTISRTTLVVYGKYTAL